MTLYIILLSVFVLYVSFVWIKYGVQESISASYYKLEGIEKMYFTFFCWGFAVPAIILTQSGIMFLAGVGICFVGAAPEFKAPLSGKVHFTAAVIGILFSQLAILLNFGLWEINIAFGIFLAISVISKIKNSVWWIEIAAFVSVCVALAISVL